MIHRLIIFGATGDLTARYLLPGLGSLYVTGQLGNKFEIVAASREDWDTDTFRGWASDQLVRHGSELPPAARQAVVSSSQYFQVDVTDRASVQPLLGSDPVAAYLALPPSVFSAAISSIRTSGLPPGSAIVLEKPFGRSLQEAVELNRLLSTFVSEEKVFRVDHFLAMSTVQNILGTRLANRILEPLWNSAHIAEIEIIWDESLALEGRAGYYDGVGALKDMLQNHLLQLLCLVCMEPPVSLNAHDLRDRKVDVLRTIKPLGEHEVRRTRRARYTTGAVGGRTVPSYLNEEGVDPGRSTETFAEIELEIDNWRWHGTVFRMRSGKALGRERKEVAIHFRSVPHLPFLINQEIGPNVLRFGLEPEDVTLELTGMNSSAHSFAPLSLTARLDPGDLPAYGRLILDVLEGNPALSIRGDEAEESWRVVSPVIAAWENDDVPLFDYQAGSAGPSRGTKAD
jgi:glucose-6-phosphate 1-dehydrogenase